VAVCCHVLNVGHMQFDGAPAVLGVEVGSITMSEAN
jgi:hypothetical protein